MADNSNNYRELSDDEYFLGFDDNGKPENLLIIFEKNSKEFAREFKWIQHKYFCLECKSIGKIVNEKYWISPLEHKQQQKCLPKNIDYIYQRQKDYENINQFGKIEEKEFYIYLNNENDYEKVNDFNVIYEGKIIKANGFKYERFRKKWICAKCSKLWDKKSKLFGGFINKELYLPKKHICCTTNNSDNINQSCNSKSSKYKKSLNENFEDDSESDFDVSIILLSSESDNDDDDNNKTSFIDLNDLPKNFLYSHPKDNYDAADYRLLFTMNSSDKKAFEHRKDELDPFFPPKNPNSHSARIQWEKAEKFNNELMKFAWDDSESFKMNNTTDFLKMRHSIDCKELIQKFNQPGAEKFSKEIQSDSNECETQSKF